MNRHRQVRKGFLLPLGLLNPARELESCFAVAQPSNGSRVVGGREAPKLSETFIHVRSRSAYLDFSPLPSKLVFPILRDWRLLR